MDKAKAGRDMILKLTTAQYAKVHGQGKPAPRPQSGSRVVPSSRPSTASTSASSKKATPVVRHSNETYCVNHGEFVRDYGVAEVRGPKHEANHYSECSAVSS